MLLTRLGVPKLWGERPESCYRFMRWWASPATQVLARGRAYGIDRVPATGGLVVAANHFATIDPALVGAFCRRTVYFMAKIELLSVPVIGEFLRWTGAFAVRRGEGDRDSLRVARWAVNQGHAVGLFMEGTRQKLGYPGPVHPGAVMIAVQEGVPVVPCGVDSFGWSIKNRRQCALVWGEPLSLEGLPRSSRGYKEGALILEEELVRLWRLAAQAAADGLPPVLPDGSRREGWVKPWASCDDPSLPAWPVESWAAGPLGPVYPKDGDANKHFTQA